MFTPTPYITVETNSLASKLKELKAQIDKLSDYNLTERYHTLLTTYNNMVNYMLDGYADPSLPSMHSDLIEQFNLLMSQADLKRYTLDHKHEQLSAAYQRARQSPPLSALIDRLETLSADISDIRANTILSPEEKSKRITPLLTSRDATTAAIFDLTWTTSNWSREERDQANRLILSDTIPAEDKSVFVSAATLSTLTFRNRDKHSFLFDAYLINDPIVSPKALTGFILTYLVMKADLTGTLSTQEITELQQDDPAYINDVYTCAMCLTMALHTKEIGAKIEGEIIPLILGSPKTNETIQHDITRFIEEGANPEWIDEEKMNKKLQQFSELQKDGADLNYNTFKTFKNNHFFMQPHRWFYPFSSDIFNSVEQGMHITTEQTLYKFFLSSSSYSDSDKYSFCYLLSSIHEQTLNLLKTVQNIDEEMLNTAMQQAGNDSTPLATYRNYIADLFRFFTLSPCRNEFDNPFTKETLLSGYLMSFHGLLNEAYITNEQREAHADFLMRNRHYDSAINIYKTIMEKYELEGSASLQQKIGYCHEKCGNHEAALKAYVQANKLKPNSKWTLRRIISTGKKTPSLDQPIEAILQLMEMEPDNTTHMTNCARMLTDNGKYEQAAKIISKVNYLAPTTDSLIIELKCDIYFADFTSAKHLVDILAPELQSNPDIRQLTATYHYLTGNLRLAHQAFGPEDDKRADNVKHAILRHLMTRGKVSPEAEERLNLFIQSLGMEA